MTCDDLRLRLSTAATYSDEHFAAFLLNSDPLSGKLTATERREIITGALHCGVEVARDLGGRFAAVPPTELAARLGVKIVAGDLSSARLVLSTYDPGTTTVTLNKALIEKMEQCQCGQTLLPENLSLTEVTVAHELFHHIESRDKGVFSRQFKVTLWRFGPLRFPSTVSAAGEIAATVCAKTLCGLCFNPVLLEAVALYVEDTPRMTGWFDRLDRVV